MAKSPPPSSSATQGLAGTAGAAEAPEAAEALDADGIGRRFDAVVMGASAGGVEALQAILGSLPAGFVLPVVVVLHLPPDRPSHIAALIGRCCALPVHEAQDKQPLRGGEVYFAPPNYHLLVEPDHSLALSVDPPVLFSRPAIDPLFDTAAAVFARRLLAVLLTGASADGSAGLRMVRARGGTAWVQDPASAQVPHMPAAALAAAGADAVLSLPALCCRFSRHNPA